MKRVLVTVCGGVAEVSADEGVEVCMIDYDNEPDAVTPLAFVHLQAEPTPQPEDVY